MRRWEGRRWVRRGGPVLAVLGALVYGFGCATPPLQRRLSPEAAYLYRAAMKSPEQASYAKKLGELYLEKRRGGCPASGVRVLAAWRKYESDLRTPLVLSADAYRKEPQLEPDEIRNLDRIIQKNPALLSVNGGEACPAWRQELQGVKQKISALEAEYDGLLGTARQRGQEGAYMKAVEVLQQAFEIGPERDDVNSLINQMFDRYVDSVLKQLADEVQKGVQTVQETQQRAFGTVQSTPELLGQLDANLDKLDGSIASRREEIKRTTVANEHCRGKSDEAEQSLRKQGQRLDALRSAGWAESLKLLAKAEAHWNAYEQFVARMKSVDAAEAYRQPALSAALKQAYGELLPLGVDYYINRANVVYTDEQFGVALIFCDMAQEMLEYAELRGIAVKDATGRTARLNEPKADATLKLKERLARRLVLLDFVPAVTEEGVLFGDLLRDRCHKKFEAPNDSTWALSVPEGKSLLGKIDEIRKSLGKADYLIEGVIKEITIEPSQVVIGRQMREVPGIRITEMPNPLYKKKDKQPPLLWEQEVYNYEETKFEVSKKIVVAMSVDCEYAEKKAPLALIEWAYTPTNNPFKHLVLGGISTTYSGKALGTPRTSLVREDLAPNTEIPKDVLADMTSDKEIRRTVLEACLNEILLKMTKLLEQYPMTCLASQALQKQKASDRLGEVEAWAECFCYLYQLSVSSSGGQKNVAWLPAKKALAEDVQAWWETRWANYPEDIKNVLRKNGYGVWESVVKQVLSLPNS